MLNRQARARLRWLEGGWEWARAKKRTRRVDACSQDALSYFVNRELSRGWVGWVEISSYAEAKAKKTRSAGACPSW